MTPQTDKTTVQEWIVSVVPEIKSHLRCDSYGADYCLYCDDTPEAGMNYDEPCFYGRPIQLPDVLRAWNQATDCLAADHDLSIGHTGWFQVTDSAGEDTGMTARWDLSADFDHQKPEVYSFLAQFVSKP